MRFASTAVLMGCVLLSSCNQIEDAGSGPGLKNQGRYAGIGTFDAGRLWAEMVDPKASTDPAAATLADDEHVIVVIDSHTGEVRQCGDHSGFCVSMNPWTGESSRMAAPVKLTKHAADLVAEDEAGLEAAEPEAGGGGASAR